MANPTIAERIAELEADRARVRTAIASAQASATGSFTLGDFSVSAGRSLQDLRDELTRIDKSLQRLYRGGRGLPIDLSAAASSKDGTELHDACGLPI